MSRLKEKLGPKKKQPEQGEFEGKELPQEEERLTHQAEGSSTTCGSSESISLTEKLKAAFHEKPKQDPELERKKELDHTIRDFRKSFRHDVRKEVKHIGGHLATGVKSTITALKGTAKTKRKDKETVQAST